MTENDTQVDKKNPDGGNDTTANDEQVEKQNMIPQSRFNDQIKLRKQAEEKLATLEKEKEEARKKRLEEEGKFKELLIDQEKELETLRAFKESRDKEIAKEREDLISKLSDDEKEIYGELSNNKLRKHLETASKTSPPITDDTPPRRKTNGAEPEDWTKIPSHKLREDGMWERIIAGYQKKK